MSLREEVTAHKGRCIVGLNFDSSYRPIVMYEGEGVLEPFRYCPDCGRSLTDLHAEPLGPEPGGIKAALIRAGNRQGKSNLAADAVEDMLTSHGTQAPMGSCRGGAHTPQAGDSATTGSRSPGEQADAARSGASAPAPSSRSSEET